MSINQDILDDLASSTGENPEVLKSIGVDPMSPTPGTVMAPEASNLGGETPITDEVRAKLMNPQTKFVELRDGVETTNTMGDMLGEIVENTTISAADVGRIIPRFEGFDKQFHPRSFTKEPSKVNYHLASAYMGNKLKVRQEEVCNQFDFFFSETLTDSEESFELYRDFYADELIKGLQKFQVLVAEWKKDPDHIHKQLVEYSGEKNAATDDPKVFTVDGVLGMYYDDLSFSKFQNFAKSYEGFKKKNLLTAPFIRAIKDQMSIDDFISAEGRVNTYGQIFNAVDLIEAMSSPYLVDMLQRFEKLVEEGLSTLYKLEEDAKIDHKNFIQVRDFVIANGEQFDRATAYCHYYAETIDTIRRLFLISTGFLEYFQGEK